MDWAYLVRCPNHIISWTAKFYYKAKGCPISMGRDAQIHGTPLGMSQTHGTPLGVSHGFVHPCWGKMLLKGNKMPLHIFHARRTRTPHAARARRTRMSANRVRTVCVWQNRKKKGLKLSNFLIRDAQILGKPLGVSHGFGTSLGVSHGFGHPCWRILPSMI